MKVLATILTTFISIIMIITFMYIGYNNKSIDLQNSIKAHQESCKVTFDETWKTIQQTAQVTDKYAEDFKTAYTSLMSGRYEGGIGKFMGMITESNPNLEKEIYTNLQNTIKSARTKFANEQKMLIDKNRTYNTLRQQIPGVWFLSNSIKHPDINIVVVTSTGTNEIYSNGYEDNIELFK